MIWPYAAAGALIAIIGAYFYGRHDGAELAESQRMRDERVALVAREAAQKGAAAEIAKLTIQQTVINNEIERITRESIVYRNCKHDPDGMRVVNSALTNGPEPTGDSKLPAKPGAAEGR